MEQHELIKYGFFVLGATMVIVLFNLFQFSDNVGVCDKYNAIAEEKAEAIDDSVADAFISELSFACTITKGVLSAAVVLAIIGAALILLGSIRRKEI